VLHPPREAPGFSHGECHPLVFCRECGQHYYVVDRPATGPLQPRDLGALSDDRQVPSGFILPDPEERYTVDDPDVLPEDWVELRKDGTPTVRRSSRNWLPRPVYVVQDGACNEVGGSGAMAAWFVPAPFRFCLACHVSYASTVRSDFGKLASLSTEGRSTATTVLSLAIVQALRAAEGLPPRARKLLSFTDNRQDASLQAGHFNDFIQLGLLRAALYAAVAAAGEEGLTHEVIAHAVTAQDYVSRAINDILVRGLRPFVERRVGSDGDLQELVRQHVWLQRSQPSIVLDAQALLRVMERCWFDYFHASFPHRPRAVRSYINELWDARNRCAHPTPDSNLSDLEVEHILGSAQLLLTAVGAKREAGEVADLRRRFAAEPGRHARAPQECAGRRSSHSALRFRRAGPPGPLQPPGAYVRPVSRPLAPSPPSPWHRPATRPARSVPAPGRPINRPHLRPQEK
jgi:Swt1-like HEPN